MNKYVMIDVGMPVCFYDYEREEGEEWKTELWLGMSGEPGWDRIGRGRLRLRGGGVGIEDFCCLG